MKEKSPLLLHLLDFILSFIIGVGAFLVASESLIAAIALVAFVVTLNMLKLIRLVFSVKKELQEIRDQQMK